MAAPDIAIKVGANTIALEAGMQRAGKSVAGFQKNAESMSLKFAKIGANLAKVGAAIGVSMAALAGSAARTAKEIDNLARLSGVGVVEFQKLAAAGKTVGFSAEKMADIFKDVNDKFGDFIENGAGPLKDFFVNIAPQVGVTADQFARLSGPEALQLYVSSLERAGVSQQQMTFYMEALANDATALIPLLRNGGKEMGRLGNEAERTGRIMSVDAVRGGAELDKKLSDLAQTVRTRVNTALLENADKIAELTTAFTDLLLPALISVGRFVADVAGQIAAMATAIGNATSAVGSFYEKAQQFANDKGFSIHKMMGIEPGQEPNWLKVLQGTPTNTPTPEAETSSIPKVFLRSGFTNRTMPDDIEALQEINEQKIEIQEEFEAASIGSARKYAETMENIEEMSMQSRLQSVSGALGDLASLMSSSSSKMFKVGKAAAIAQAVIDGYQSAIAAWKHGMVVGGPPAAAAFTAASVAKTAGLISQIRSASASGAGGGGAGGGGSATPTINRTINVELVGDTFSPQSVRGLIRGINSEIENGARLLVR